MIEATKRGRRLLCAVLAMLGALSACEQPDADEFLKRALDYREKGDISASIVELKNALQQEPRNAPARLLLGRNYLTIRDLAGAEKELLRAREYGAPVDEWAEPLTEVWMSQRRFKKLLSEIQTSETASAVLQASLAIARGRALRALGNLDGAKQEFKSALARDPKRPVALVGLARIAMQVGSQAEIDESVARAVAVAPEDLNVVSLKGDHDFLRGDYASAERRYQAVLKARPDRNIVRLALARSQIRQGKTEPAKGQLDLVLARIPAHPDANYLRASLALKAKDYEAAREHAEQVLLTTPHHAPSLLIAGAASYLLNRLEQADRHLSGVLAQDPENRLAQQLRAATRVRIARAGDGRVRAVPLLDDSLAPKELLFLVDPEAKAGEVIEAGRAYFAGLATAFPAAVLVSGQNLTGESGETRLRLRAALEQTPRDVRNLLRLARMEHEGGNDAEAISLLEDAMAAEPYSVAPRALLGQLYFFGRRPRQALEVIAVVLSNRWNHPVLLGLSGLSQLQAGRPVDAKLSFRALVEIQPGNAQAQHLLALAYREDGDPVRSREHLEQVLRLDPGHVRVKMDIIRSAAQAGELRAARGQIDGLLLIDPENPEALDLSGAIALLEGRNEAALVLLRRALARAPSATAALKLAYAQQRAGNELGSRETLTLWLRTSPGDVGVRMALANKHLAAGTFEQARSHYTKIILLTPNNVAVLNNLAWVHLQLGDLEAARDDIERARHLAPDDPRVIDTFGAIQLRSGNPEAAARALRRAAKEMPDSPRVHVRLAQALAQQGETTEARDILQRILSEHGDFPGQAEARSLLGELGG